LLKNFIIFLLLGLLFTNNLAFSNVNNADNFGSNRIRICTPSGSGVEMEGLDWDPSTGGNDVHFESGNPVCKAFIGSFYVAVKAGIVIANKACKRPAGIRILPSPIKDARDLLLDSAKAVNNKKCAVGLLNGTIPFTAALTALAIEYRVAESAFTRAHICGYNWMANNPAKYNRSSPDYKDIVEKNITAIANSGDNTHLDFSDKQYREWFYSGVEFEDKSDDDICYDVTECQDGSNNGNCNDFHPQRYYMHGFQTPNFNCEKYNIKNGQNDPLTKQKVSEQRLAMLQNAYNCCKKRSSEYLCIQYDPIGALGSDYSFCKAGTNCIINGITFEVEAANNNQILCAKTYSLCPYNFNIDGGSTICDYYRDGKYDNETQSWKLVTGDQITQHSKAGDCNSISEIRNADCTYNNKAGKCKNYCQYMNHCAMTNQAPYIYQSNITSPYFSSACINFAGDSQNEVAYNTAVVRGAQRHFTAPIAQCIKETIENVFYNHAGHTKCKDNAEIAGSDNSCTSGEEYKLGDKIQQYSFFERIQDKLQKVIRMVLVLSVMFYGFKILLGIQEITKKDLMMYIVKMGLVLYFATGDAWQTQFFNGVYNASTTLSNIVFKIQTSIPVEKRDGCQFGNVADINGVPINFGSKYPNGKEYLALWDTLDCKSARYLSFGPSATVANLLMLIVAGFMTEPFGLYFALMLAIFGFFMIAASIRALHIFLSSAFSIIIMVYVSPIIIPTALFERTSEIFKNWLTQLVSFCIQPMILFAYIALFVNVLDIVLVGSATFEGKNGPNKVIICNKRCKSLTGQITLDQGQDKFCNNRGDVVIDPNSDSFLCIININNFDQIPSFEIIGIGVPFISKIFTENGRQKILTVMKGALIMYIMAKFLDQISNIAAALIGGTSLPGSSLSAQELFNKALKIAKSVEKRGHGALKKHGGNAAESTKEGVKNMVREIGNQGKNVSIEDEDDSKKKAADGTGSSDGSKDDKAASRGEKGSDEVHSEGNQADANSLK
jgi:type IV secretory pathway VirB6-like protein